LTYVDIEEDAQSIEALYEHYSQEDQMGKVYEINRRFYVDEAAWVIERVRELGIFDGAASLLDVGCGYGFILSAAEEQNFKAVGFEIAESAAEAARKRGLTVCTGTGIGETDFGRAFDVVTCMDVIEHVTSPRSFVQAIDKILKPGGLLVVKTPNADGLLNVLGHSAYKLSGGKIHYLTDQLYNFGHIYRFSPATLGRLLQSFGFETLEVHQSNSAPGVLTHQYHFDLPRALFLKAVFATATVLKKQNKMTLFARKSTAKARS
jgi:2-polyprenyl-3-methyl-5-hydroxy-6-metoxy-1,4-benzoquinol methylase